MKFLLNTGWIKRLISKTISFFVAKKTGIKTNLNINNLEVEDTEKGILLRLDLEIKAAKEEFEKMIENLM